MKNYYQPLQPSCYYHVFNRCVGKEQLFFSDENYQYFFRRLTHHILPVAELFAYSLMPNHFHLLIRVRSEEVLIEYFEKRQKQPYDPYLDLLETFVIQQFSNWLNGYAKAINKMFNRKGGLFIDYIKRSELTDADGLRSVLGYIHRNAVHHRLCRKMGEWHYDSYQPLLYNRDAYLQRQQVMDWFHSLDDFIDFHAQLVADLNESPKDAVFTDSGLLDVL